MTLQNILIIDPDTLGHHPNYLGLIASAFCDAGFSVTVAVDTSSEAIQEQLLGQAWFVIDFKVPSQRQGVANEFDLVRDQFFYWTKCKAMIENLRSKGWAGSVFFPYLDRIIYAIGLKGSPDRSQPVSGIFMRAQFGVAPPNFGLKRRFRQRVLSGIFRRSALSRQLKQVFFIDPVTATDARLLVSDTELRITELVDPANSFRTREKSEARSVLGLPAETHLILVYGEIARRKAAAELLAALRMRRSFGRALIVGRSGDDLEDSFMKAVDGDRMLLDELMIRIDRRVTDAEEQLLFESSDSVWVAYHDHPGMSGVLVQAGQMRLPVFGCSSGAIGMYCMKENVGISLDPQTVENVVRALDIAAFDPHTFLSMGENGYSVFKNFTRPAFRKMLAEYYF